MLDADETRMTTAVDMLEGTRYFAAKYHFVQLLLLEDLGTSQTSIYPART